MTVSQLIRKLQALDPKMRVVFYDGVYRPSTPKFSIRKAERGGSLHPLGKTRVVVISDPNR